MKSMRTIVAACLLLLLGCGAGETDSRTKGIPQYPIVRQFPALDDGSGHSSMMHLTLGNNGGWLVVSLFRQPPGSASENEWMVTLGRIDHRIIPEVSVNAENQTLCVGYGPCFVRDSPDCLRILRQRKPNDNACRDLLSNVPTGKVICNSGTLSVVDSEGERLLVSSHHAKSRKVDVHIWLKDEEADWEPETMGEKNGYCALRSAHQRCQDECDLLVFQRSASRLRMSTRNHSPGNFRGPARLVQQRDQATLWGGHRDVSWHPHGTAPILCPCPSPCCRATTTGICRHGGDDDASGDIAKRAGSGTDAAAGRTSG
jgi:hypothetical protein